MRTESSVPDRAVTRYRPGIDRYGPGDKYEKTIWPVRLHRLSFKSNGMGPLGLAGAMMTAPLSKHEPVITGLCLLVDGHLRSRECYHYGLVVIVLPETVSHHHHGLSEV